MLPNCSLPCSPPLCAALQDLYKPEGPRLRKHLSAVLNFAMFREEKLAAYTALQEQLEGLLQEKEAAAGENAQLQAELRRLQEERAAELPQVAALEAEQQALYAENQQLNKQQSGLSSEVRGLKQGANALTDEASQLRYKLSQAKGQTELLRSQIVQSPQKIQALLGELSAAVERERAMVADAGGRTRWLRAVGDVHTNACGPAWLRHLLAAAAASLAWPAQLPAPTLCPLTSSACPLPPSYFLQTASRVTWVAAWR